jgi:hypothetical protein
MTGNSMIFQLLRSMFGGQAQTRPSCSTSWEYSSTIAEIGPGNSNLALRKLWDKSYIRTPLIFCSLFYNLAILLSFFFFNHPLYVLLRRFIAQTESVFVLNQLGWTDRALSILA